MSTTQKTVQADDKRPPVTSTGPGQVPDAALLREVEKLREELKTAHATVQQLRVENEEARTARWRAEVNQLEKTHSLQELAEYQAHVIQDLRASTSWRITQPLRDSSSWLSRQAATLRRLRQNIGPQPDDGEVRAGSTMSYPHWIERFDTLNSEDTTLIRQHIAALDMPTTQVIWQLQGACAADVGRAIHSLQSQLLEDWIAHIHVDGAVAADAALQERVRHDTRLQVHALAASPTQDQGHRLQAMLLVEGVGELAPHALYLLHEAALRTQASVVLADEDTKHADGQRESPRFMPRYSPEFPTVASLAFFRESLDAGAQLAFGPLRPAPQVAARIASGGKFTHVPFVLFHARQSPELKGTDNERLCAGTPTQWPLVSIIIPTRDRLDLMGPCLASIMALTDYPRARYEIVVVDNGSIEPQLLSHLAGLQQSGQIRVIRDPKKFNYARLNNLAAAAAQGEMLAFVNNDVVVHDPLWLQRLVAQAAKPDVGVVGAKLLYPDMTVQHGGVVLGIQGVAAHAHHNLAADAPGYLDLSVNTHGIAAVTGACMMVQREVFDEVGGFDEKLAVAFNDTLLCMDVLRLGLRNMYVAQPLLIHYESKTRGFDDNDVKRALFQKEARYARSRHRTLFKDDPYYSPNLSLEQAYALACPPRQAKPWHSFRRQGGRMRLLLLSSTHEVGHGVPVVLDIHARHLSQEGHEVILGGPRGQHEFAYPGCQRAYLESPQDAASFAVTHGVDCVVIHTPPFFSTMRWLGPDIKTLVYDHGEPPPSLFPDAHVRRQQLIEKDFCLEMADALYANSEATRDESGHTRMGVIPLGNSHLAQWDATLVPRRLQARRALGLEDRIVVLNVCRFHKGERFYKGIDDYCVVKDRLESEFPQEAERFVFVLVGKGTEADVEEMEDRGLRVFANVSDAQMLDLYCCADVYANFSRWEGYNLGIGQALALGLDVVASDIPVHRSFPIFTSSNTLAQAQKILELGRAGSSRASRSTPWAPSLHQLSGVLKQLVYGSSK